MANSRWLIFIPVAVFALFAPTANAQSQQGLQSIAYSISEIPPTMADDIYPICNQEIENNINRSYDGEPLTGCPDDMFMVHMTGTIIIPEHETIQFWVAADDGGVIKIGTEQFGTWDDKGCSATEMDLSSMPAGNQPLDLWMYENGGGTCIMLAWNINNQGWEIVPDEAFLTATTWESTTTSTTPTTSTSTIAPSTTVPVTSELTTTTLQTTTTSSSLPQVSTPLIDTTTSSSSSTYPPSPSTTDLLPITQVTVPPLIETFIPIPDSVPTEIDDEEVAIPLETLLPELVPLPPTEFLSEPSPTQSPSSSILSLDPVFDPVDPIFDASVSSETRVMDISDVVAPEFLEALSDAGDSEIPLTAEQFDTAISAIDNLSVEQAVELIEQILDTAVTADQAEQLAVNPEVLAVITSDQAEQIFEVLDVSQLDDSQKDELVTAVQEAPTEVRKAFEKKINIFGAGFDDYVPTGSSVPVSTRRSLIAIGAGVCLVSATPTRVRR